MYLPCDSARVQDSIAKMAQMIRIGTRFRQTLKIKWIGLEGKQTWLGHLYLIDATDAI